jgi:hypothetical protein
VSGSLSVRFTLERSLDRLVLRLWPTGRPQAPLGAGLLVTSEVSDGREFRCRTDPDDAVARQTGPGGSRCLDRNALAPAAAARALEGCRGAGLDRAQRLYTRDNAFQIAEPRDLLDALKPLVPSAEQTLRRYGAQFDRAG